jgi:CheY-like chemotaxis protein
VDVRYQGRNSGAAIPGAAELQDAVITLDIGVPGRGAEGGRGATDLWHGTAGAPDRCMPSRATRTSQRPWQVAVIAVAGGSLAGLSLFGAGAWAGAPTSLSVLAGLGAAAAAAVWLGSGAPDRARPEAGAEASEVAEPVARAALDSAGTGSSMRGALAPSPSVAVPRETPPLRVIRSGPEARVRSPAPSPATGGGRVLLVDRDPEFVARATTRLAEMGLPVCVAATVREARRMAASEAGAVEVVVVDLALGEEHGIEAVGEVRRTNPEVRVVLLSGDVRDEADVDHLLDAGIEVVRKPVAPEVVAEVVERVKRRERHLAGQLLQA